MVQRLEKASMLVGGCRTSTKSFGREGGAPTSVPLWDLIELKFDVIVAESYFKEC